MTTRCSESPPCSLLPWFDPLDAETATSGELIGASSNTTLNRPLASERSLTAGFLEPVESCCSRIILLMTDS